MQDFSQNPDEGTENRANLSEAPTDEGDVQATAVEKPRDEPSWFLRGRGFLPRALAIPFALACLGVLMLLVLYHWPRARPWACYLTLWPAFIWFGLLLPLLLLGIPAVRPRWFLCGCALWLVALTMTEDVVQCLKFFPGRSRAKFCNMQWGVQSYLASVTAPPDRVDFPLRVVTWNVLFGSRGTPDEAIRQLAQLRPDIVFMQEYSATHLEEAVKRSPFFKGYEFRRRERNVILSRFPILQLPDGPRPRPHGCVCRIEIAPGMPITCISVHLTRLLLTSKPLFRGWSEERVAAGIQRTRDYLESLRDTMDFHDEAPMIVAGDFNLPPRYPDLAIIRKGFKDCFQANGYGWGKTVPARLPLMRIDFVFVPKDAKVYYAGALPTQFSDHRIVMTEIVIPIRRMPAAEK